MTASSTVQQLVRGFAVTYAEREAAVATLHVPRPAPKNDSNGEVDPRSLFTGVGFAAMIGLALVVTLVVVVVRRVKARKGRKVDGGLNEGISGGDMGEKSGVAVVERAGSRA
jgi:hypothetical protein